MSTPRIPASPRRWAEGKNVGNPSQATITTNKPGREITFSQAINEALSEEMRRDPTVFIMKMSPRLAHRSKYYRDWSGNSAPSA